MRWQIWLGLSLAGCGPGVFSTSAPPTEIHVAAAANLANIFPTVAAAEQKRTGYRLVPSFGSTAALAKQIESGAPFDLFLAADSDHPTALAAAGLADTPHPYARGRVVLWAPKHPDVRSLADLTRPEVKVISVANPQLAPYGHAAMEALGVAGILDKVRPKIVFAQNISAALSYADTGNADAALTAYSLVWYRKGNASLVPESLHAPIVQSLCSLTRTSHPAAVKQCVDFLIGPEGKKLWESNGYPPS